MHRCRLLFVWIIDLLYFFIICIWRKIYFKFDIDSSVFRALTYLILVLAWLCVFYYLYFYTKILVLILSFLYMFYLLPITR